MADHTKTGNCFALAYECEACPRGEFCDVCHQHDMPRGDCDECEACEDCKQEVE